MRSVLAFFLFSGKVGTSLRSWFSEEGIRGF